MYLVGLGPIQFRHDEQLYERITMWQKARLNEIQKMIESP